MPILRLFKVRGGWWRITVERGGELALVVILGTRDGDLARQKLEKYRKVEESLAH